MFKQSNIVGKEELIEKAGFKNYFKADQWAEYNRKFFNELAPKYDYLNEVMTFGMQKSYKKKVIQRASVKSGDVVLDIATGSGDMAMFLSDRYPQCKVIGVDVAEKMLEIANERTKHYSNIEFKCADAMNLPFENNAFDVALTSYGLRNLSDIKKGIQEMKRVTKPGGEVIIVDLGKPSGWINQMVYQVYFEKVMPFLGRHIFHRGEFNSFQYLPESNKYFPSPEELKKIMYSCGIKNIKTYSYLNGIVSHQVGYA